VEVDVGIDGRDEELCKPLLQLFHSLGASNELQKELEHTLQHFLSIKNKRKQNSKEALIYPIVANTISKYGLKINAGSIWQEITDSIEGQIDEKNPNIFHPADYPDFYRSSVIGMIVDKFGGELDHKEKGNLIIFNQDIFTRMGKQYDITKGIQTKLIPDSSDPSVPLSDTPVSNRSTPGLLEDLDNTSDVENKPLTQYESVQSDQSAEDYPPDCYYCNESFIGLGKSLYEKHVLNKHPRMPCYPGEADIHLYSLRPKRMPWESNILQ